MHPADFSARNDGAVTWQAICSQIPLIAPAAKLIGTDNAHRRVRLSESRHPRKAFREQPVVSRYDFAIFAVRGNKPKSLIVVSDYIQKFVIPMDDNAVVRTCIFFREGMGSIRTAVINDRVVPV